MSIVRHSKLIIVLLNLLFIAGCAPPHPLPLPAENGLTTPVYLINLGWHTGLAVRQADIPSRYWPEREDFPDVEYLEVGWGDYDFYRARGFNAWFLIKAGLVPTASVLHVVGLTEHPRWFFPSTEIARIDLSAQNFERLIAFIHDTFDRGNDPRARIAGPGHYATSFFYPARGSFHLFNNCNTWVARGLRAARVPIVTFSAITAGNLMSQARSFATPFKAKHRN